MSAPPTPDCCAMWSRIVPHLRWFVTATEPRMWAMPCIDEVRINVCPSCGAERRSVERDRPPEDDETPRVGQRIEWDDEVATVTRVDEQQVGVRMERSGAVRWPTPEQYAAAVRAGTIKRF